ncbi:MAG: AI-2E family transporter [Actinomycetota bacterium]|nr:AI-2E family transporter [Actinomycetota bacterium]
MATAAHERPSTRTVVRVVLTVVAVLILLYAAYLVRSILILVLIAGFLAVGLDPAVRRLEKWGMRRGFAVATIFLAALLFIVGFALAVVPPLVKQVTNFATNLPEYVQDLSERNPRIEEWVQDQQISTKLQDAVNKIPSTIGSSFGSVLGVAGSVLAALFNTLTVLVLTIYFLLSLSRIRAGSLRLVPASRRARVKELMDPILEKIGGYIAGQVTVALIAGSLAFIFLAIAGVPFPVALGLWVAIASLIPLVGATLGAIPAVIVAFFTSTGLGIATLVYFLVYQQIENYIIAPKVMTKAVDVSPAAVLLAALVGGSLLGFVGALMAIPTAASLKLIAQEVVIPKAEKT